MSINYIQETAMVNAQSIMSHIKTTFESIITRLVTSADQAVESTECQHTADDIALIQLIKVKYQDYAQNNQTTGECEEDLTLAIRASMNELSSRSNRSLKTPDVKIIYIEGRKHFMVIGTVSDRIETFAL